MRLSMPPRVTRTSRSGAGHHQELAFGARLSPVADYHFPQEDALTRFLAAALVFALPGATSAETVSAQFCRDVLPNILSMAASVEKTPGEFWAVNAKFSIPEQKRFSETRDKGVALAAAAKAYREAVVAACYPPR